MNWEQARTELEKGNKVKLPEWTGHWFSDGKSIKVDTADCEVLNTPYTQDYYDRTDWQITDGLRDFGGAIKALKAGKKVCRVGWNGAGMFLYLVQGSTFTVNRAPLNEIYPEGTEITYRPHIDLKTADGSIATWSPSGSDALAEDWQVLD